MRLGMVPMDRRQLKQYQALKKEMVELDKSIDKLRDRAMEIPVVAGKVTGSSHEWPYTEQRYTVLMDEPKEADAINRRIRVKQNLKQEVEQQALEIEQFIASISDSTDRQIFDLVFLSGMTQQQAAFKIGYTQARVSQRISDILKD